MPLLQFHQQNLVMEFLDLECECEYLHHDQFVLDDISALVMKHDPLLPGLSQTRP